VLSTRTKRWLPSYFVWRRSCFFWATWTVFPADYRRRVAAEFQTPIVYLAIFLLDHQTWARLLSVRGIDRDNAENLSLRSACLGHRRDRSAAAVHRGSFGLRLGNGRQCGCAPVWWAASFSVSLCPPSRRRWQDCTSLVGIGHPDLLIASGLCLGTRLTAINAQAQGNHVLRPL